MEPTSRCAAVGRHQPHRRRAAVDHLLQRAQKVQQQLLQGVGAGDLGGDVVEDLQRRGLLRQAHGLAGDAAVHVLVQVGQLRVQAADAPRPWSPARRVVQRAAGAGLALADAGHRVFQAHQGLQRRMATSTAAAMPDSRKPRQTNLGQASPGARMLISSNKSAAIRVSRDRGQRPEQARGAQDL
jgi:HPt (histidine-containing phosphotransfer) domain-containing protein